MDRELKSRLIKEGYNPFAAIGKSEEDVGCLIGSMFDGRTKNGSDGLLLNQGFTNLKIYSRDLNSESFSNLTGFSMDDFEENHGGLLIRDFSNEYLVPLNFLRKQSENLYLYPLETDDFLSLKSLRFNLELGSQEVESLGSLELRTHGEFNFQYFPKIEGVERDKLFWKFIGEEVGLDLRKIKPKYTDKQPLTPWYLASDKESKLKLALGTRYRVHSVEVTFPEVKEYSEVIGITERFKRVVPQTSTRAHLELAKDWNGRDINGVTFETHIDKWEGLELIGYIEELLKL